MAVISQLACRISSRHTHTHTLSPKEPRYKNLRASAYDGCTVATPPDTPQYKVEQLEVHAGLMCGGLYILNM